MNFSARYADLTTLSGVAMLELVGSGTYRRKQERISPDRVNFSTASAPCGDPCVSWVSAQEDPLIINGRFSLSPFGLTNTRESCLRIQNETGSVILDSVRATRVYDGMDSPRRTGENQSHLHFGWWGRRATYLRISSSVFVSKLFRLRIPRTTVEWEGNDFLICPDFVANHNVVWMDWLWSCNCRVRRVASRQDNASESIRPYSSFRIHPVWHNMSSITSLVAPQSNLTLSLRCVEVRHTLKEPQIRQC